MTWTLILLVHMIDYGRPASNALTSVPGFTSEARCKAAGEEVAEKMNAPSGARIMRFVCVSLGDAKELKP